MNKNEFLKELEDRLNGSLPEADVKERVEFYTEAIDDRIEDGKSEEEAVAEIGTVDEVVAQIASETSMFKIVKQKVKPKRRIRPWEIVLAVVLAPIWIALAIVTLTLILVAYILLWVLVIVSYAVEIALGVAAVGSLVLFFIQLPVGGFNLGYLGISLLAAGLAMLMVAACIGATKLTIKASKKIHSSIKRRLINRGK